VEATGSG